jgi:hypothetical protein
MNKLVSLPSIIYATILLAFMFVSCGESEPNAYLRSLRRVDKVTIDPVDSASLSDVEKFTALDIVKADDWLIMKGDYRFPFYLLFYNLKTQEHFFALRKGRGPGEVNQAGDLQKQGDRTLILDCNKDIMFEIDVSETERTRMAILDTMAVLSEAFAKPVRVACCGNDGFITTNGAPDLWYSYSDMDGKILSSVPALEYKELSGDSDAGISYMISSSLTSSPDGTKACVGNNTFPAISFSTVENGKLTEYKRYAYPGMGIKATGLTKDWVSSFCCLQADDEYVYALYSGIKYRGESLPNWESRHLIVYDWSGEPVKHFFLKRNITKFFLEGHKLYCDSSYPDFNIYVYDLEKYL